MIDLPEPDVVQIPLPVGRQIDRIGPTALRCELPLVLDGPAQRDVLVDGAAAGQAEIGDDQVSRWRLFDQHRQCRRRGVVGFVRALVDGAARSVAFAGVGDHEDVVRAHQVVAQTEALGDVIAGAGRQTPFVAHLPDEAVGVEVEGVVCRQIDLVHPPQLVGWCGACAGIDHPVPDLELLTGEHALGAFHRAWLDPQIGTRFQRDGDRFDGDVVAFAAEFLDRIEIKPPHAVAAVGRRRTGQVDAAHVRIGVGDQVPRPVGPFGNLDLGCVGQLAARSEAAVVQVGDDLSDLQVGLVERCVARQVDAVGPDRFAGVAGALVLDGERHIDLLAGAGCRVELEVRYDEVGLAVGDRDRGDEAVVREVGWLVGGACVLCDRQPALAIPVLVGRVAAAIDDEVQVVRTVGAGWQGEVGSLGVAGPCGEAGAVVVHHRTEGNRAVAEHRVGREEHRVGPALGARPHRLALVLDRPRHGRLFAREILLLGSHREGHEIRRAWNDLRGGRTAVVELVRLVDSGRPELVLVGENGDVARLDCGRQIDAQAAGVAVESAERLRPRDAAQEPLLRDRVVERQVGRPDAVEPVHIGRAVFAVLHRPADLERRIDRTGRISHHLGHLQVGLRWRRVADDVDRPRLVVVAVELGRIVGVRHEGVFKHRVVGVGPWRDVVTARLDHRRDAYLDDRLVALALREQAGVHCAAQENAAIADGHAGLLVAQTRRRAGLVAGEPDRVNPGGLVGLVDAVVGHLEPDLDLAAIDGLRRRTDVAGDQIGRRVRVDGDRPHR